MKRIVSASIALAVLAGAANAQSTPTLSEFLESIDRAAVSITGGIGYDRTDDRFFFYEDDRGTFGVSLDAGRQERERIEENCESGSFFMASDLCRIEAEGTVEVRGGRVFISVERVISLEQPE